MFKRMKLKRYLMMVFAVIILMTAVVTTTGSVGMFMTRNQMQAYIDQTLSAELSIKNCRIHANLVSGILREAIIAEDRGARDQMRGYLDRNIEIIDGELAKFKNTSDRANGIIAKYDEAYQRLKKASVDVFDQANAGKLSLAEQTLATKANVALWDMEKSVDEIDQILQQGGQYQKDKTTRTVWIFAMLSLAVFVGVFVVSVVFSTRTTRNVARSVGVIQDGILKLSEGDLNTRVNYDGTNEFGVLAEKLNFTLEELSRYAQAVDADMTAFSDGDFTTSRCTGFIGDFAHIQEVIGRFRTRMNETLSQVSATAGRVDDEAMQISGGAQTLAQGATEQASSVEELSATVEDISKQIGQTADYSGQANEMGQKTAGVLADSQREMGQMMAAMKDIATASENIRKIIKVIDDVSFQTNILALNAAVEAARAGTAGKGFAVVADEVRNLAQKSAEAAKNTAELIEKALEHVSRGEKLAESANTAFGEAADYSKDILDMVEKIAVASQEQAVSIAQVSQGIDQITGVIQTNSAAAEESAAASQQLNAQADVLNQMLSAFRLEEGVAAPAVRTNPAPAPAAIEKQEPPAFDWRAAPAEDEPQSFAAADWAAAAPVPDWEPEEPATGVNRFDKY